MEICSVNLSDKYEKFTLEISSIKPITISISSTES
jgi:hypothetical protein